MSYSNYTKNILNIKDKNIHFNENCYSEQKIGKKTYKIFHGTLTYEPNACPNCGCLYEKDPDTIIKYGYKKNCKVKVLRLSNYPTIVLLDKQRFLCKYCNSTFVATTDLVEYHKQISNNTITNVKLEMLDKGTEKSIAKRNDISVSSVNRISSSIDTDKYIQHNGKLPTAIGIDEFKATSDTISKMAFIIVDHEKRNVYDILNSRKSCDVYKYFSRYSYKERCKVKIITMDLYKPYYKLMKKTFPKAIIVPDRFHIVIQIRNALDKTRIALTKKSNPYYTKLKKYWKLILKNEQELDDKNKSYNKHFQKYMTQKDIVIELINTNSELKNVYNLYQGILKSLRNKDYELFKKIIQNTKSSNVSKCTAKALRTFKSMEIYIKNAFIYDYSNGIVEGINNLVKQIKHAACGYRKFKNLKARIMMVKGIINPII